jgi:hypothetical protein
MNSKKRAAEKRAEELFDLLTGGDLTSAEIMDKTGWVRSQLFKAVQTLRDILAANGDVISVTAEPQGLRETWLYSLRAGKQIVDPEKSRWVINRLQDAERRVETIAHVLEVAVNSLDGRTSEGKKARVYHLHIKRAQEEVALLGTEQ